MMLVPLTTDAPIYHRPFGTVGLIALNVVAFLLTAGSPGAFEQWGLVHGLGLTPLQWLTSNFIHANWLHLLGNMVFLWGFGLVVEGKIGWRWFVPVYLGIGMTECAIEQVLFTEPGGVSFGASAIIFGLMAMALIWAPSNELTVGYWFLTWIGTFDIPIVWFSLLKLLTSLGILWLIPGATSEMLHLLGAGVGAAVAFGMLWRNRVDCEGWDLISVATGNTPRSEQALSHLYRSDRERRRSKRRASRKRSREGGDDADAKPEPSPKQRFSDLVREGKSIAAVAELQRIRHLRPGWQPAEKELLSLARGLRSAKQWPESVALYGEFLQRRPGFHLARLELAELYVLVQERPAAALKLLAECDRSRFSPQQQRRLEQVTLHAQRMIDRGVIEIEQAP